MIALTSWFYAFWRCKNTKISENTQIFLMKILENTQIFLVKILENTQIRRDGKQCKNTKIFGTCSVSVWGKCGKQSWIEKNNLIFLCDFQIKA